MTDVKILFAAGVALFLASFAVPAHATDLPGYATPKPNTTAASQGGAYLSVGAGIIANDINTGAGEFGAISLASSGGGVDLRAGYDFTFPGTAIVIGPLVGVTLENTDGHGISGEHDFGWYAGGRIGVYSGNALLYAYGAWRQQDIALNIAGIEVASHTLTGFEYGAGLEIGLTDHVRLGTEVARISYGTWNGDGFKLDEAEYAGRVRLGYRF